MVSPGCLSYISDVAYLMSFCSLYIFENHGSYRKKDLPCLKIELISALAFAISFYHAYCITYKLIYVGLTFSCNLKSGMFFFWLQLRTRQTK